jgi:hypothetical protein
MMKVDAIDLLVVGLPVAMFAEEGSAGEADDRPPRRGRRQDRDGAQGAWPWRSRMGR